MPAEYEIVGQVPATPLPGLDLSAAQVAGQTPIAPAQAMPAQAAAVAAGESSAMVAALRAPGRDGKGEVEFFPVRAADGSASVVDVLGRVLMVKKLTVVQKMRLFKICGPDGSRNPAYFGHAATAAAVQTMNGVPLANFTNEAGLERVADDLGDEGIEAAAAALMMLTKGDPSAERAAVVASAKNS